jgi:P-aminobenzoate N-oxygenase AurF
MTTSTTRPLRPTDREDIAQRLLRSSAKASYDPLTEIDWETPVGKDNYAMPPHRVSLYGTTLWDGLTEDQRKELSRQEIASIACIGIWFETILMQMLIRHAYDRDPTTSHVQYSYTEIGDECRHSVMFARFVQKMGAPYYGLDPFARFLGLLFKATSNGPLTFGGALFVEELLDQMQREAMADDQVEPLTRAVARLHVTEEARHMRYAREELIRDWPRRSAVIRAYSRLVLAVVAAISSDRLVNPGCYARVGLDPKQARRAARRNPHWRASKTWFARQAVETFTAAGLISGPARYIWRKAGLVAVEGPARPAVPAGPGGAHDA